MTQPKPESAPRTFEVSTGKGAPVAGSSAPSAVHIGRTHAQPTAEEVAAVQATRAARKEELQRKHAANEDMDEPEAESVPRQPIDFIELTLPNGVEVKYGPPPGVSLQLRIAQLLGADSMNSVLSMIARTVLCVREINGVPQRAVTDQIGITKVANMIGDEGIDILYSAHNECWPPLARRDLPEIKKTFR